MASPSSAPARALRLLGIALLVFVAILVVLALLLVLFVQSDAMEAQVRQRVLPAVSARLDREVVFDDLEAAVLPRPRVRVRGLRVAGRTEVPIFVAETVEARLRIWPLITSRGRRMVLDQLRFESAQANLVRLSSGQWDLPRLPPEERRRMDVDLENIAVVDAELRWIERGRTVFTLEDLDALASYVASTLVVRSLGAEAYGAEIDGGGSRLDLAAEPVRWVLDASIADVAFEDLPLRAEALVGRLGASLDLAGEDLGTPRMLRSATGQASVRARDLVWRTLDLPGAIAQSLTGLFEEAGLPTAQPATPGETRLGDWDRRFSVRKGWVEIEEPLEIDAPMGRTRLGGRWSLTANLDLEAQTALEPEYVRVLTRNELRPDEPVPIRYRIRGTVARPRLEDLDPSAFLPLLAEEGGRRIRRELEKLIPPFGTGTTDR